MMSEFLKRKVLAVREYPPFCGRNAPSLTEEEVRIIKRNKTMSQEVNRDASKDSASSSQTETNARDKVKDTLALYREIVEKLLHQESTVVGKQRVDLQAAKEIKERKKEVNTEMQRIGSVPGVEVGDEFVYRAELVIIGLHRSLQAGVDVMTVDGDIFATSVIASEGGYPNDLSEADVLIYSGQGGNLNGRSDKPPTDQKLEGVNLALRNSMMKEYPVRVTRAFKKSEVTVTYPMNTRMVTYTYDGLYMVKSYWRKMHPNGTFVYEFEMRRIDGQPSVAWKRAI